MLSFLLFKENIVTESSNFIGVPLDQIGLFGNLFLWIGSLMAIFIAFVFIAIFIALLISYVKTKQTRRIVNFVIGFLSSLVAIFFTVIFFTEEMHKPESLLLAVIFSTIAISGIYYFMHTKKGRFFNSFLIDIPKN